MLTRKTLYTLLAAIFISVVAISPVLADGSPTGGATGDNQIHPWDINDGSVTPGTGVDDAQAPTLTIVVFYPGWFGNLITTPVIYTDVTRAGNENAQVDATVSSSRLSSKSIRIRNVRR